MQPSKKVLGVKRFVPVLTLFLLVLALLLFGCTTPEKDFYIIKKINIDVNNVKQTIKLNDLNDVTAPYCSTKQFLGCDAITGGWKPITIFDYYDDDSNYLNKIDLTPQSIKSDVNFDGNILFNDTYWDDVSVSLSSSGKPGGKPPTFSETDYAWNFEDQALALNEQYLFGGFEMPHGWKIGTSISCHIHAHPLTTSVGDYNFELSYSTININAVETSPIATTLIQTTEGISGKVYLTQFPDINMVGKTLSNTTEFRLKRLSSSTSDTFTGGVAVDSFGCHFEADSLGSKEKLVK